MFTEPTINDFIDLIRSPLADALDRFRIAVRTIENRTSRGQTGNRVSSILDQGKQAFETAAIGTFQELRRIVNSTKLDRKQLRDLTVQELTNFLMGIKAVIDPDKLKRMLGSAGGNEHIDKHIAKMDQSLPFMIRQMDTGLLNLDVVPQPAKAIAGDIVPPSGFTGVSANAFTREPQPLDTSHDIAAAQINAEHRRRQTAAVQATAGTVEPTKMPEATADRSTPIGDIRLDASAQLGPLRASIRTAVAQNREAIDLATAALSVLIDEKIASLRQVPPNSPEAQANHDQAIAYYEDLKKKVDALREAASKSLAAPAEQEAVVNSTTSFTGAMGNWWTKRHVQAFDMGLFLSGMAICSMLGASGVLVAGICGAIVGGKQVADVIKAITNSKDSDKH